MSKRSPEEAGLAGLLGGYGSGSDVEDGVSPGGGERAPEQGLAGLISADDDGEDDVGEDDDDDEPMAGPARPDPSTLAAYALAPHPETGDVNDDGPGREAGESGNDDDDEDGPAAGPARPDAMQARMAYPDVDPEPHREDNPTGDPEPGEEGVEPGPSSVDEPEPRVHSAPASLVARVKMPPAPEGECETYMSNGESLQSRVHQWLQLKRRGISINDQISGTKGFRNPDFLQSALEHFKVEERGTMISPDVFDPSDYPAEDYYDELASAQRRENERREKERRELGLDRPVNFASAGFVAAPAQPVSAVNGTAGGGEHRNLIDAAIAQARERAEKAAKDPNDPWHRRRV